MNTIPMIKKVSIAMLILTFFAASSVVAGEYKTEIITGTLEQTDDGIVLSTKDGEQFTVEGQDVSNMIGQSVRATGTVQESESGKSINISSVKVLPSDAH